MSVNEVLERDADRPAYVQFEARAIEDKRASLKAGHFVSKDVVYALVTPPYSRDRFEQVADKWLARKELDVKKGRIPQQHLDMWKRAYDNYKKGQEEPLDGTNIKDWNILSPAQCLNLISSGCRTIEDLAQCNDEGIRRIGRGGVDLKKKARAWLQAAKDHGPLITQVSALQKENEQLKGTIDSIQDQVVLLTRQLDAKESIGAISESAVTNLVEITADDIIEKTPTEQYEEKFGKPPHHRMKDETILKKLKE